MMVRRLTGVGRSWKRGSFAGVWRWCLSMLLVPAAGCVNAPASGGGADGGPQDAVTDDGPPATAASYFVSPDGDDQADGRSAETPLGTIAHAVELLQPGDTLGIMPGTYNEAVRVEGLGGADSTITIRGEGGTATFDGTRANNVGFYCENCTNVTFEDLEFTNYTDVGILVLFGRDVTVRNLTVHENGFAATMDEVEGYGIQADEVNNITIENNDVYRNGPNPQVPDRWLGTGIDLWGLTDAVVRNNHSYENVGGGLLVEDCTGVLVEGNEINGNDLDATVEEWWDGGVWVDGGGNVTLRDNNIHDNLGPGVEISDEDLQNPKGYVLENNTIVANTFGLHVWNFGTSELPADDVLKLTDNTITDNTDLDIWIVPWFLEE